MSTSIGDICNAVADVIMSPGVISSTGIDVIVSWTPLATLSQVSSLRVTVMPASIVRSNAARDRTQREFAIDIGVQKRAQVGAGTDDEQFSAIAEIADSIADITEGIILPDIPVAWISTTQEILAVQEHLRESRSFTQIIRVLFREMVVR